MRKIIWIVITVLLITLCSCQSAIDTSSLFYKLIKYTPDIREVYDDGLFEKVNVDVVYEDTYGKTVFPEIQLNEIYVKDNTLALTYSATLNSFNAYIASLRIDGKHVGYSEFLNEQDENGKLYIYTIFEGSFSSAKTVEIEFAESDENARIYADLTDKLMGETA